MENEELLLVGPLLVVGPLVTSLLFALSQLGEIALD